jgi:hypothetical protein
MRKPGKTFKIGLKKSLRDKLGIKMPKSEIAIDEEPYLRLGFGVNAYLKNVMQMLILMTFITICFSFPMMHIFSNYVGLSSFQASYGYSQYSLGNMGGSAVSCG